MAESYSNSKFRSLADKIEATEQPQSPRLASGNLPNVDQPLPESYVRNDSATELPSSPQPHPCPRIIWLWDHPVELAIDDNPRYVSPPHLQVFFREAPT